MLLAPAPSSVGCFSRTLMSLQIEEMELLFTLLG